MAVRELPHEQQRQACINHCTRCHAVQVCADLCRASADTLLRASTLQRIVCRACAEVCAKCAAACEALVNDAQLKECTAVCLSCFDACAAIASAV
ncbi:MAG: hypothetical protein JOZ03_10705 [Gammaproteobacteria bacterium]|nr:hypothetical protein [Gammaproteobacteria bacterium]